MEAPEGPEPGRGAARRAQTSPSPARIGGSGRRDALLERARSALAAVEAARQRLDDLNVYPVPDGDTGTNLALTARAVVEALERPGADDRETLAREVAHAALLGARGNSGVILSQIVRGAAESFAASDDLARALRGASDAAAAAVRDPVEGTMLTAIRELAEAAEAGGDLDAVLVRGEESVARTRSLLPALAEAGVVDAGAAGLLELVRGFAGRAAETLAPPVSLRSVHRELSRYRYCTSFVVEGERLDAAAIERALEPLGDSLLVVGDGSALRAHVHTDDPTRALAAGGAGGRVASVEIFDMHEQIEARTARLRRRACAAVAVVAGAGNRLLFESLGAHVAGAASVEALLEAVEAAGALEAVLLPNGSGALAAAREAAARSARPVRVVPAGSLQAGLSALVAFDPERGAAENRDAMSAAAAAVAAGAVEARDGGFVGLVDGEPVAEASSLAQAALAVAERLLDGDRGVLTLLAGGSSSRLDGLVAELEARHPGVEVELHEGGQPGCELLLGAE